MNYFIVWINFRLKEFVVLLRVQCNNGVVMDCLQKCIKISDFDYFLPDDRIAGFPLCRRDESKLLVWRDGRIEECLFNGIDRFLPENALLIFNNTRVIQARMLFRKPGGAQVEVFCLEPFEPAEYVWSFARTGSCIWRCLVGNAKRWKAGAPALKIAGEKTTLAAERLSGSGDTYLVRFSWDNPRLTFAEILELFGELPIPPYLNRRAEESDKMAYQTVYSRVKGSVAAPTAGLHFTDGVFESLKNKSVDLEEITLHVGAGTFKPVKTETLAEHEMHTEWFSVSRQTLEKLIEHEGSVFAAGTTSVRTLESLYHIGVYLNSNPGVLPAELSVGQWDAYSSPPLGFCDSIYTLIDYLERYSLSNLVAHTKILIAPGYDFKVVNGMVTNFHQPESTLLLLVSAFTGGRWREIYDYALLHGFRFLSYGDSSLLQR
jgi:S-adenosylmethionine:tRNA ribosyltransferase-isomerase